MRIRTLTKTADTDIFWSIKASDLAGRADEVFSQQALRVRGDDISVGGVILAGGVEVDLVFHELRNGGRSLLLLPLPCLLHTALGGRLLLLFAG